MLSRRCVRVDDVNINSFTYGKIVFDTNGVGRGAGYYDYYQTFRMLIRGVKVFISVQWENEAYFDEGGSFEYAPRWIKIGIGYTSYSGLEPIGGAKYTINDTTGRVSKITVESVDTTNKVNITIQGEWNTITMQVVVTQSTGAWQVDGASNMVVLSKEAWG